MDIVNWVVDIDEVYDIGYLSVLFYMLMFSFWYKEYNCYGKLFYYLCSNIFEWGLFKLVEIGLMWIFGCLFGFCSWCNSMFLVCRVKS